MLNVAKISPNQELSLTVILSPSACFSSSRAWGVKPRNSTWARSPRTAATWAAVSRMNSARKPSRYGLPLSQYSSLRLPTQCEPGTYSTNLNGPVPRMFFSGKFGSFSRTAAL